MKSFLKKFLINLDYNKILKVLLFELQHGFREKRSCETQLVILIDEISKNTQVGKQTDLILLDFSKAFDNQSCT